MDVSRTSASLDALQLVINDVLVQTGKAIRTTFRDGHVNVAQHATSTQPKLPDCMRIFHSSLDDIENEIIRAKSILQRDIGRLQAPRLPVVKPEPVEARSRSPMVVDIDYSPQAVKTEPAIEAVAENRSVAPFPDMGMDMSVAPKEEAELSLPDIPSHVQTHTGNGLDFTAPVPMMGQDEPVQPTPQVINPGSSETVPNPSQTDLNFTTMQFSLAHPDDGQNPDMNTSETFDISAFNNTDGTHDDLSLSLLPDDHLLADSVVNDEGDANGRTDSGLGAPQAAMGGSSANDDSGVAIVPSTTDDNMNNILTMDLTGDGNDFDFSLEGDSFNDLMTSHDGSFDTGMTGMEHGTFDDEFFGLSKPDGI